MLRSNGLKRAGIQGRRASCAGVSAFRLSFAKWLSLSTVTTSS
jgi:hypothetical protein